MRDCHNRLKANLIGRTGDPNKPSFWENPTVKAICRKNKKEGRYLPGEYARLRSDFRRLLPGIPIEDLYDGYLTVIQLHLSINMVALDDELKMRFPDEWGRMSMEELITARFGKEATELINNVL